MNQIKLQKLIRGLVIMAILCLSVQKIHAQPIVRALPYSTGFDGDFVDEGWTMFQLKSLNFGTWGISKNGAPSPPNLITHDYPVDNTNGDTVEDWYVSPPIKVTGKSTIEVMVNVYTIGQRQSTDYFGVWYSKKSNDPKSGDFKELADLTRYASNKFTNWQDTAGILLNDSAAITYIAFKYGETTNWFTVGLDNVKVKLVHNAGINPVTSSTDVPALYPNPSNGDFTIKLPATMVAGSAHVQVYDMAGRLVLTKETKGLPEITVNGGNDMLPGLYQYTVSSNDGKFFSGKLVIN